MSVPHRLVAAAPTPLRRRARRLAAVRPSDVRGLLWARRSVQRARDQLDVQGTALRLDPPDERQLRLSLPVLESYLRVRHATCLERTYVVQRYLASHGADVAVVVGVRTSGAAVEAHAWLEGYDPASAGAGYREITRVEAPSARAEG